MHKLIVADQYGVCGLLHNRLLVALVFNDLINWVQYCERSPESSQHIFTARISQPF